MKPNVFEGCGYCRECVKLRVMKAVGREPENPLECAYKHILDSYSNCPEKQTSDSPSSSTSSSTTSTPGSCSSNCRWTSSGWTASRNQHCDFTDCSDWDDNYGSYVVRKRVQFVKRRKVR